MNDRLDFVQKLAQKKGIKIEYPKDDMLPDTTKMKQFSAIIADAHSFIKLIELNVDKLVDIKNEVENATGKDQQAETTAKIEKIGFEIQSIQKKMAGIIDSLDGDIKQTVQEDQDSVKPETRIKKNLFGSIVKKYQDACIRFQNVESEIKNIMQTKLVREAEIALGRKLDDNERTKIISQPEEVQILYEQKLTGAAHIKLQNAVADINERHKDIQQLEHSINQVHKLVTDLATLVHLQGEMIDNIEANIRTAKDYVLVAEKDIIKAKENMQSARKKKCCILIIVLAVLVVILAPILGTQLSKA